MMQSIEDSYAIDVNRAELAAARSDGDHQAHRRDVDAGEDGVWDANTPATSGSCCGGRKGVLTTVLGVVLVIVVIVAFAVASGNQNSSVSNADTQASTTLAPPTTTFDATSPTTAASDLASTTTASDTKTSTTSPSEQSSRYNCDAGFLMQSLYELRTNHYMCSDNGRYRFGMDNTGSLIFADDDTNKTTTLYNGTHGDYFYLNENGTFVVEDRAGENKWEQECSEDVKWTDECFLDDCPYLHLHDGGTLVLRYMEEEGREVGRNVLHIYNLTSCNREDFICDSK